MQYITAGGIEGEVAAGEGESTNMDTRTMGACGERNWRGGLGCQGVEEEVATGEGRSGNIVTKTMGGMGGATNW